MKLKEILTSIQPVKITGNQDIEITGVDIDSRQVESGHLFMAMRGTQTDGHAYIPAAVEKGATAILCEELPAELAEGVTYIQVADSEDAVGKSSYDFLRKSELKIGTGRRYRNKRKDNDCHLII